MAKNKLKNLIELVIACVVAIVVTVAAIMYLVQDNTYAWFAKNDQVSADGMNVEIKIDESVVNTVECFTYSGIDSSGSYTFVKIDNDTDDDTDNVTMEPYNSLNNNVYQIIIKINLTEGTDSVTVFANTSATVYLGSTKEEDNKLKENGNSLSSVVAFEVYYSDSSDSSDSSEIVYNSSAETVTFTPPETLEDYSFVDNKTLISSISLGEEHTFTDTSGNAVYIVLKYNVDTITEVFSRNIGNEVCNAETVPFDLYDFSFSIA
ncbi:MAG: hypothetical protein ACI4MH_06790 [Candidatus Coproplasma sp.]